MWLSDGVPGQPGTKIKRCVIVACKKKREKKKMGGGEIRLGHTNSTVFAPIVGERSS